MLVLFDNGTPRSLAGYLIDRHTVTEARARWWDQLGTGPPCLERTMSFTLKRMEVHFTPEQEAQLAQIAMNEGTDARALGTGRCLASNPS